MEVSDNHHAAHPDENEDIISGAEAKQHVDRRSLLDAQQSFLRLLARRIAADWAGEQRSQANDPPLENDVDEVP